MKSLLPAIIFCGALTGLRAQDSLVQRWGAQFIYHPYDFFAGVHYERGNTRYRHRFMLSTGFNRTFFQARIYPQIGYEFSYEPLHKRFIQAGPLLRANASLLHVNRNVAHGYVYDEELFAGAFIGMGNYNHFRISAGFGPSIEQSWSALNGRPINYFTWNYFCEISYSHAF